jgi:hypothetical protein
MKFVTKSVSLLIISVAVLHFAKCDSSAAPITFTGSSGQLSASTTFDTVGNSLVVTLSNISTYDVLAQNSILSALFFDISGPQLNLSPGTGSALLAPGSVILFDTLDSNGNPLTSNVGGEWSYLAGISSQTTFGQNYGISSSGFGIFGNANFPGPDLDPPAAVNGINYGLTSAGDNITTGQSAVTGTRPLIKYSVIFTLPGLPNGFDPSVSIANVSWQYGTSLGTSVGGDPTVYGTPVPEPTSGALLLAGMAFGAWTARRRRVKR